MSLLEPAGNVFLDGIVNPDGRCIPTGVMLPSRCALPTESEDEPESDPRGARRQNRRWLLIAKPGGPADGFRRVAVGQIERISIQADAQAAGQRDVLFRADVEHPDVVFTVDEYLGRRAARVVRGQQRLDATVLDPRDAARAIRRDDRRRERRPA